LRHFQGVNIVVLEVGMGGRHDATAAVDADISVVTNVSLDHMEHLGGTVEAIAGEIAGAITSGDVVTACIGAALDVVAQRAARCNATLHLVTEDMWRQTGPRRFIVQSRRRYELETRLDGAYQGQNVALAVKTAEVLGVDAAGIVDGVAAAWLPGRLERFGNVMLDGAHNPAAMRALRTSLEQMQLEPACIVFGTMRDKDIPGIIRELPPGDVIATAAATGRAAAPASIAAMLRTEGRHCLAAENVATALQKAREMAGQGVILVTGSIRLVGNARELLY
ncbi:MAG: bifunctional folylpolyglutamate synthase/dihydrofolate synthase, partial [Thermoplasmatota archaeon]